MKKLALILTLSAMTSAVAFGQGWISFNQAVGQAINTNSAASVFNPGGSAVGSTTGPIQEGNAVLGTTYYFTVLVQPWNNSQALNSNTNPVTGGWTFFGMMETNKASGQPGTTLNSGNFQTTTGWPTGVTNQFIIVGWSASLGTTWLAVSNEVATGNWAAAGYFGVSSVGDIMPDGVSPGFNLFGNAQSYGTPINNITTLFAVGPVPEPSTMALAGLGGLAVLLFRRRK